MRIHLARGTQKSIVALCSALAIAVVPSISAFAAPESPSQATIGCPDVAFIGMYGTGESAGASEVIGKTYSAFAENAKGKTAKGELLDYGKITLRDYVPDKFADLDAKLTEGVILIGNKVTEHYATCGNTRFVFAGYSAGAWIVDKYLARVGTKILDRVDGVVLYGDPQEKNSPAKGWPRTVGVKVDPMPGDLLGSGRVKSFCLAGDPICGGLGVRESDRPGLAGSCAIPNNPICTHTKYAPGNTEEGGEFLAGAVLQRETPAPPQLEPRPAPGPIVPSRFIGSWSGSVTQDGYARSPYPVQVSISGGSVGTTVATASYDSLGCAVHWTLKAAQMSRIVVHESVDEGPECVDVDITLTLKRTIQYTFDNGAGRATLRRTS